MCSTAGQISNTDLVQRNVVATAIQFKKSNVKVTETDILYNSDITILGNRIEEEIEVVKEVLGDKMPVCGFYSHGEISPTLNKVAYEKYPF